MRVKFAILFLALICMGKFCCAGAALLKKEDTRSRELKYQYEVLKQDEKDKLDKKILNITPSGYMTVDEYEKMSEYKDKSTLQVDIPKIPTPSDFKYIPQPLYRIVKYNAPPGGVELKLGKRLYLKKQINAQGIVSPDFSIMVYPAVYYYADSVSVAGDLFVIPLDKDDTNLNKILKANTAKRLPDPILSTDKAIDNYASFRTLTPVDFSPDGTKLLAKQKIGSSEDGIWQTNIFTYDFQTKTSYDLSEIRDAIVYFWDEYMALKLDDVRWDIYPLGFDKSDAGRVIVQGFAFTGEKPVFLGTWSIDVKGNQSRLVTFDKTKEPSVSINGYKIVQDGVEEYTTAQNEEKALKQESKVVRKQYNEKKKQIINGYKEEYKYTVQGLKDDYKDEYRDYKKLRSMAGATEDEKLQAAYKQYLIDQSKKDIQKGEKQIDKLQKDIEKIDQKLEKLYDSTGENSTNQEQPSSADTNEENPSADE